MTLRTNFSTLSAWVVGTFTLAAALPALAEVGTSQQRLACMSDAMTYCAAVIPDEAKIEGCLRRQRARISVACRAVLDDASNGGQVASPTSR